MNFQLVTSVKSCSHPELVDGLYGSCKGTASSALIWKKKEMLKYDAKTKQLKRLRPINIENGRSWKPDEYLFVVVDDKLFAIKDDNIYIRKKGKSKWLEKDLRRFLRINFTECILAVSASSSSPNKPFIHVIGQNVHIRINPRNYKSRNITKWDMPYLNEASVIEYNGSLYTFGGYRHIYEYTYEYYDAIHVYDIDQQVWFKNYGHLPDARAGHATVRHKHYAIIIGGRYNSIHCAYDDILIYNLENGQTVRQLKVLPYPIYSATATIIGNEIHQFGGHAYIYDEHSKYDFVTKRVDDWKNHIVITLQDLDKLFIFGIVRMYFNQEIPMDLVCLICKYYC